MSKKGFKSEFSSLLGGSNNSSDKAVLQVIEVPTKTESASNESVEVQTDNGTTTTTEMSALPAIASSKNKAHNNKQMQTAANDNNRSRRKRVESIATTDEEKDLEIRATFIVQAHLLEKIKGVAYWDRLQIKEVIHTALSHYIAQWEGKNGVVKPAKK